MSYFTPKGFHDLSRIFIDWIDRSITIERVIRDDRLF